MLNPLRLFERYRPFLDRVIHSFHTRRAEWIVSLIAFCVVNGYIAYRFYREWPEISAFNWQATEPVYLVAAALVQFVSLLVVIAAWSYILRRYGQQISFRRHFKIYTLSNLARKLPAGIGLNVISRVYMYDQDGSNRAQIVLISLLELPILAIAAALVTLITLLLPGGQNIALDPKVFAGAIIVCLMLIPTPLFRKLLSRVARNQSGLQQYQPQWYDLYVWVILTAITIILGGCTLFLFTYSLGIIQVNAAATFVQCWALIVLTGTVIGILPIDIGALNGVTLVLLATLMPMPQAILLLVAWRLWVTANEIIWGAIGLVV
jgi:uncharacterized membrane protein YbhN (UPF0104 family)